MKFGGSRTARTLAAALATLAVAAPAALADDAVPSPEAPPAPTPKMSVAITKASAATLAGSRALVPVRCNGEVSRECVGTLALETSSGSEKVAYSIAAGEKRIVVVPLPGGPAPSARAVTETMQLSGASVRTSRVLRLK